MFKSKQPTCLMLRLTNLHGKFKQHSFVPLASACATCMTAAGKMDRMVDKPSHTWAYSVEFRLNRLSGDPLSESPILAQHHTI